MICACENLETQHLDIKCAFQNGKLYDVVYVAQPGELGDNGGRVLKLKMTVYGLKQAAREWHKVLVSLLHDLEFVRSRGDPALFTRKYGRFFIFIWVDDLLVFTIADVMETLCAQILYRFKGRSEGEIGHVLGIEILRDRKARTMTITHRKKISDLLSANSLQGCRTSPTPLVPKEKLKSMKEDPSQEPATVFEHKKYMKVVGGIQYIAVVTRPDIAFAAHSLARHMAASATEHWLAAQHVVRYLLKTVNLGLQFSAGEGNSVVEAYSDSDFANALSLKSVSGNMLMMSGKCVFCRSKRQDIITGDTTEAELIGMSAAANELMWLKKFCTDLAIDARKPTLCGDNKSSNLIAVSPVSSDQSLHIRVRHLRVREAVELDEITVDWIGTKFMLADGLTKVLLGPALSDMRDKLHLVDVGPAPREPCGGVS